MNKKFNPCMAKGCKNEGCIKRSIPMGVFSGKNQGMHIVTYYMCSDHYENGGDVDREKFFVVNSHIVRTMEGGK